MLSSFPRFRRIPRPFTLGIAASWVEGELPDGHEDRSLRRITPLRDAGPDELALLAARSYLPLVQGTSAGALLVSAELADELSGDVPPRLVVADAHQALAILLSRLHPEPEEAGPGSTGPPEAVHPTAVVGESVDLGEDVHVGPFAVIETGAQLGDRVRIGAHAVVGEGVEIGEDSWIFPHAVLYPGTVLGRRVRIHSGARLGVDGFGYVFRDGQHRKVPQVGRCVIGDDVEIGANTTLDRGSIGDTLIERDVKIDNLVQLGHNVAIGAHSILAAQTGVAGSTRLGSGVLAGGQVGIAGHLSVGDGARLSAQAGITGDVRSGQTVMGFPARPRMEFLRSLAAQKQSRELLRRVRALEARLDTESTEPDEPG